MDTPFTAAQMAHAAICEYENLLHDGFGLEDPNGDFNEDGVTYLSVNQVEKKLSGMTVDQIMDFAGISDEDLDDYMETWAGNVSA